MINIKYVSALLTITTLLVTLKSNLAFAEGVSGGGGRAVVCKHPSGKIKSVELLDLYEGRVQNFWHYQESDEYYVDQALYRLEAASKGISGYAHNAEQLVQTLRENIVKINRNKIILPDSTKLIETPDSWEVIGDRNCEIKQLANYLDGQERLLVDGIYWSFLSPTNKAALLLHEVMYDFLRDGLDSDSIRARRLVSYVFSGHITKPVNEGLPSDRTKVWSCFTHVDLDDLAPPFTNFWLYNNELGELVFQYEFLFGRSLCTKSTTTLNGVRISARDYAEGRASRLWMSGVPLETDLEWDFQVSYQMNPLPEYNKLGGFMRRERYPFLRVTCFQSDDERVIKHRLKNGRK